MKDFVQRHKPLVGAGVAAGILIVGVLAFGVFGIHTAFIDNEVSEANPFVTSEQIVDQPITTAVEATTDDSSPPPSSPPEIVTIASGSFIDSAIHSGTGDVTVLSDGDQTFLRFEENFSTDNGPDLNVYLRANDDSGDFIDLGDLKGNIGSQNYEIPAGTDLDRFTEIDVWCVRFGVSFTTTHLA